MWAAHTRAALCIVACLLLACVLKALTVSRDTVSMERMERMDRMEMVEGFQGSSVLSSTAFAMLDERCWLNSAVVADNALGMVKHPTEARAGACVLRGTPPGNGQCDESNTVLNNSDYVDHLGIETIDGKRECVVRMNPTLSDQDAQAYADSINLDEVLTSGAYRQLMQKYKQGVIDAANLRVDLTDSRAQTDTANKNWRTQTANDAASMADALGTLRAQDARTFQDSVNSLASSRSQALSEALSNKARAVADAEGNRNRALDKARDDNDLLNASWQRDKTPQLDQACQDRKDVIVRAADVRCSARQPQDLKQAPAVQCPSKHQWLTLYGDLSGFNNQDISNPTVADIDTCQQTCQDFAGCTHFSFWNGSCNLKKDTPQASDSNDRGGGVYWWSGVTADHPY